MKRPPFDGLSPSVLLFLRGCRRHRSLRRLVDKFLSTLAHITFLPWRFLPASLGKHGRQSLHRRTRADGASDWRCCRRSKVFLIWPVMLRLQKDTSPALHRCRTQPGLRSARRFICAKSQTHLFGLIVERRKVEAANWAVTSCFAPMHCQLHPESGGRNCRPVLLLPSCGRTFPGWQ